jgi:hypothetical protein
MKLGRLPWARVSDAEYIASLRSQIGFVGHLRPWWILLNLGMLAALIWITRDAAGLILGLVNPPQWAILGFSTGAMLGFFVGFVIHEIFRNLIFAIGNFRSERLLIHYYDAFNEECAVPDDECRG